MSQTGTQIMKSVGKLWKMPPFTQEQEEPFLVSKREGPQTRTYIFSVFLFETKMASHVFFFLLVHSIPFSLSPSSLVNSSTCATILMTLPHNGSLSLSVNRTLLTLSSLTQSVSQFWISRRKNQNGRAHPLGWFPCDIPNLSNHRWP